MVDCGFHQAQSDNLPKIDVFMMSSFLSSNTNFISAEIRGVKAARSERESYGDDAIGYVQVKREGYICTVKAKITPEHSVRKKAYIVILICNETANTITSVQCEDCAARLGGCKHAVAFIAWPYRRSEDPPATSVTCYWKKSKLSSVGTSLKLIKSKDLAKTKCATLSSGNGTFLAFVIEKSKQLGRMDSQLTKYYREFTSVEKLSVNYLLDSFFASNRPHTPASFLVYATEHMQIAKCKEAFNATVDQIPLWFELRYARVTASKAYDAARCKTLEGSLVESILGALKHKDSAAMTRGRLLEPYVIKSLEKKMSITTKKCCIDFCPDYPVIGATPDGLSAHYTSEVKCPTTVKAMERYVTKHNSITSKYMAQVQLQMHICNRKEALFCIALPDFETSNNIQIVSVNYDIKYCTVLLDKCTEFSTKAVFPMLKSNF